MFQIHAMARIFESISITFYMLNPDPVWDYFCDSAIMQVKILLFLLNYLYNVLHTFSAHVNEKDFSVNICIPLQKLLIPLLLNKFEYISRGKCKYTLFVSYCNFM